jgi:hypothetical protein
MRRSWYPINFRGRWSLWLAAVLLLAAACVQKPAAPPPVTKIPSQVITEDGLKYFVWGLKLPGSSQQFKLKNGQALTWVPLSIIGVLTFTGPEDNQYRPVLIYLTSGEQLTGKLFVDQLIEGATDAGYWNVPLHRVKQLEMGQE